MTVYSFFILNKNAGMIYTKDFNQEKQRNMEIERNFSYPLDLKIDENGIVRFGARDGIRIGQQLLTIGGQTVFKDRIDNKLKQKGSNQDVFDYLGNPSNYPVQLRFGTLPLSTNDKIVLTGRFFGLYTLAWQLSPVNSSSGIEQIETDNFKLYCFHTITGIKFIAIVDNKQTNVESFLRKAYELYADYALKNPFYLIDQPIKSDLFDTNLQIIVETIDKI